MNRFMSTGQPPAWRLQQHRAVNTPWSAMKRIRNSGLKLGPERVVWGHRSQRLSLFRSSALLMLAKSHNQQSLAQVILLRTG